jgi:hypothetical protein
MDWVAGYTTAQALQARARFRLSLDLTEEKRSS